MLRLFGKALSPLEAANLVLFLATSDDPEARTAGDEISRAWLQGGPQMTLILSDAQRQAVKSAVDGAPARLDWARDLLI